MLPTSTDGTDEFPVASNKPSLTVRTQGWTWLDVMGQLVVICMFPVGVLFVIYLSGPTPPTDVGPRLIGLVVFLGLVDLLWMALVSVRKVTVDFTGVTFRYLFHTERRLWSELEPGPNPAEHHTWWIISRHRKGRETFQRGYRLTIEQAQAVLSYPGRPAWQIRPEVSRSLGWDASRFP